MNQKDRAWTANYPPLQEWLHKIEAVCNWQVLQGNEQAQHQYIECWSAHGRVFLITVRSHGNGWDIFTNGSSIEVPKTLEDAEVRLGIRK
jgi:hypothetical protein